MDSRPPHQTAPPNGRAGRLAYELVVVEPAVSPGRSRASPPALASSLAGKLVHDWSMDSAVRDRPRDQEWPIYSHFVRVSDGIRTRDRRDHNPELYQLSYAHQAPQI